MAKDFPASTFIGTDLVESVLPTEGIPPNCSFVQANTVAGLPFPDDTFDYVFQRLVVLSYSEADWVKGVAELIRVTKPGGYVELFEADGKIRRAPESYKKYENACKYELRFCVFTKPGLTSLFTSYPLLPPGFTYTRSKGIDLTIASDLEGLLHRAGLISVVSDFVSVPIGWHDREGEMMKHIMARLRNTTKQHVAPLMEMTEDEFDQWMPVLSKALEESRSWINLYYAYGKVGQVTDC